MTASARAFELKSSDRRAGADARPSALRCASGVAALAYFAGACRAAPPQAPESAPSPHMEVRAITFRGEPLAGARIELATRTVGTGDLDLDAAAPATGGERREATADSDGVVRFPAPSGVFHLRAVHGALGADGGFAPSSPAPTVGRRTLVLRPYLKIAVRRRNGHPAAGVVVKELRDGRAPIEVGRTGPDGDLLAPYDDPQSPRTFVPWFVGASEQDALPSASDGALLLPPMRRVIVHAVDADGRPLTDAGEVGLQEAWVRKARSERANARAADDLGVFARAPLREGRAEFPYVAASADLAAVVTTRGDDGVRGEVAIPPSAEGAVDAATAVCDDGPPTLVARFVDAEGRPLGGVAPELLLRRRGAHDAAPVHGVATLAADAEGRMRRTLRRSVAFADGDVWRFRLGARGLQGAAVARAPMRGVCDLGDVTLAPPAPLAAGAVVDTARAPVAGAVVRVLAERDGRLAVVASATTDADGRFAAFDDDDRAPDDAFRLDARLRSDLYARELVSVARGANDVRVDLVEPGSLAGEIVLDPAAFPDASRTLELDVRFVNEFARIDDPERAWPATPVVPTSRGAFVFPRLRAGVGRLVATLPRHDEPLATVDDVRVLPGPPTRDPRCAPL
ncbi:MAG TPA: hypothetical protein VEI02_01545, partial [Planctomycetota bacterium]|nr:hypothetical protein [Planctomycetota bacterium]